MIQESTSIQNLLFGSGSLTNMLKFQHIGPHPPKLPKRPQTHFAGFGNVFEFSKQTG